MLQNMDFFKLHHFRPLNQYLHFSWWREEIKNILAIIFSLIAPIIVFSIDTYFKGPLFLGKAGEMLSSSQPAPPGRNLEIESFCYVVQTKLIAKEIGILACLDDGSNNLISPF